MTMIMKKETTKSWIIAVVDAVDKDNNPCEAVLHYDDTDRNPKIYWGRYTRYPYYPSTITPEFLKRLLERDRWDKSWLTFDPANIRFERVTETVTVEVERIDSI